MRIWVNFIVCSLLALLVFVERAVPCVDECLELESDTCAESVVESDHHEEGSSEEHHCDHCSCSCHIPALKAQIVCQTPGYDVASRYAIHPDSLPLSPVSTPDHIPLV
jgi:hypothetical protein